MFYRKQKSHEYSLWLYPVSVRYDFIAAFLVAVQKNKQCAVAITTLCLFLLYYPIVHCLENVDMTGFFHVVLSHKIKCLQAFIF